MNIIELSGIYKKFRRNEVLKGLDLFVQEGDIFGLIGENGAGKTTTINIILGLEHPQKGTATIFGQDCGKDNAQLRKQIGFVSETVFTPDYLTVGESIKFHRQFYPTWDQAYADNMVKRLDLDRNADVSTLSRGQSARLRLLMSLAQRPKLLIIDEITAGMDALVRHDLIQHLREIIKGGGITILVATNLLYDLEKLATKIAFLENGRIAFVSGVEDILSGFAKVTFRNFDALDMIPENIVLDKIFDQGGAHAVIESKNRAIIEENGKLSSFDPKFSTLDLERTFVYMVRTRRAGREQ